MPAPRSWTRWPARSGSTSRNESTSTGFGGAGGRARGRGGPAGRPRDQQILDGLTTLPATVVNERFDLLAWNAAFAALFPTVVTVPRADRNTLWLCFTHSPCCHPYLNRADQLGRMVAQLRAAYGRHVGEPAWTGFVRRLQAASPEFSRMWAQHEVASPRATSRSSGTRHTSGCP